MTNDQIRSRLAGLLESHQAQCLFAVESGSQAWGFASANSDYDVRFVYWMPRHWYLSIESHRDVIEEMGADDLDFAGWDLRKALGLAYKSNPSLHDWLATPECYQSNDRYFDEFRSLCLQYFDPYTGYLHYRSMAKTNFENIANANEVPFKKYFYVLRPLLCAKAVASTLQPAPCRFGDLLDEYYPSGAVRDEIDALLILKREGKETAMTMSKPILHGEIVRLFSENLTLPNKTPKKSTDRLNDFFRKVVD